MKRASAEKASGRVRSKTQRNGRRLVRQSEDAKTADAKIMQSHATTPATRTRKKDDRRGSLEPQASPGAASSRSQRATDAPMRGRKKCPVCSTSSHSKGVGTRRSIKRMANESSLKILRTGAPKIFGAASRVCVGSNAALRTAFAVAARPASACPRESRRTIAEIVGAGGHRIRRSKRDAKHAEHAERRSGARGRGAREKRRHPRRSRPEAAGTATPSRRNRRADSEQAAGWSDRALAADSTSDRPRESRRTTAATVGAGGRRIRRADATHSAQSTSSDEAASAVAARVRSAVTRASRGSRPPGRRRRRSEAPNREPI